MTLALTSLCTSLLLLGGGIYTIGLVMKRSGDGDGDEEDTVGLEFKLKLLFCIYFKIKLKKMRFVPSECVAPHTALYWGALRRTPR